MATVILILPDLVLKDISLFNDVAERSGLSLELAPLLIEIFKDGITQYGNVFQILSTYRRVRQAGCTGDGTLPGSG